MPKQTFFNLPDSKQKRIVKAAMEEFAAHPYLNTSINRIIERADISKGSFYQYFDNKKDLYKHLIEKITEKKMEYLAAKFDNYQKLEFFELLRKLFIAGIEFKKEFPLISEIGDRLLNGGNEALKKEIYEESKPQSDQFFQDLLKKAVEAGEVDPKIDIEFTAFMLTDFSISIVSYFFEKHNPDDLDEIMDYVDKMLYVIKNGMAKEEKNGFN